MSARTVSVRLTAEVSSYVTGMRNASKATKDLAASTLVTAAKNREALTTAGTAMTGFGATVAAGVAFAVKKFADFDKAMSAVQAATHETAGNMDLLRDAAMEAGARTAFSASEAAEGIEALAKAGVSTEAILNGGLNGALDLAAAGGLAVGEAAEIAATAMTQFGLEGGKVPHVADLLAAAAGKAQGDVTDMGMALKQAGLVANQTGLTIEETTAGLAAFASAGLIGSDAGTSFKSMLQRLTPQSVEAAGLMEQLGFSAYDAQGNFVGLEALAGELQSSLAGMTTEQRNAAMATLFGSDAVRAAAVLYEQGAAGVADWTAAVNDSGFAQETAATRLDNLSGDIEAFMGSVETAMIKTGSAGNDLARGAVQGATSMVNAYGALPSSMQGAVLAVGGVTSAVALGAGAFLLLLPRVASTREAMKTLGTEMPRTATAMGAVTRAAAGFAAFTAVTQVLHGLIAATGETALGVEGMTSRLLAGFDQVDAAFTMQNWQYEVNGFEEALKTLTDPGLMNRLGDLGGEILTFGGNEGSFKRTAIINQLGSMSDALAKLVTEGRADLAAKKFDEFAAAAKKAGMTTEEFRDLLPSYKEALAGVNNQTTLNKTSTDRLTASEDGLGDGVMDATGKVKTQTEALVDNMDAIREATGLVLGLRDANRGYEAAVDDAAGALKENGKTLDINTDKGRANEAALDAIASSANDVLASMIASGEPLDSVSKKLGVQREALINTAQRFGMTRSAAESYADSVLQIPTSTTTTVTAKTAAAQLAVQGIAADLNKLNGRVVTSTIIINEQRRRSVVDDGRTRSGLAGGGWVHGPGTGTSDSVHDVALSNGEFVVNAAAAQANAALLEAINNGRFADGSAGGYSAGSVSVTTAAPDLSALQAGMAAVVEELRVMRTVVRDLPAEYQHRARQDVK